ncbi:MAG: hypothetical protein AABY40_00745 [Nanoarchaeota archaeon]
MEESIDKAIAEITDLNLRTSQIESGRQDTEESLQSEAKTKLEEVVSSFRVFLPHLKNQIDFASAQGVIFFGDLSRDYGDGKLFLYAYGDHPKKSIFSWNDHYNLQIYFAFSLSSDRFNHYKKDKASSDFSINFSIPKDATKDHKIKAELTVGANNDALYVERYVMEFPLTKLGEVVSEGYQEASVSKMQLFSKKLVSGFGYSCKLEDPTVKCCCLM